MQHNSSNRDVRHHGQPAERLPTGGAPWPWRLACPSAALNATPAKYALVLAGLIGGGRQGAATERVSRCGEDGKAGAAGSNLGGSAPEHAREREPNLS